MPPAIVPASVGVSVGFASAPGNWEGPGADGGPRRGIGWGLKPECSKE